MLKKLSVVCCVVIAAACGSSTNGNTGSAPGQNDGGTDGGVGGPGTQDGGTTLTGGVSFPWPLFDGTVPDTPTASGSGKTWYADPVNGNDAGSPAAGGGTALNISTDFTGAARASGSHDIGALSP